MDEQQNQTPPVQAPQPEPAPQPQPPVQSAQIPQAILPTKNKPALYSYYLGMFGLIPIIGWVLGFPALYLGIKGLKQFKANPTPGAKAHAMFGVIAGGLEVTLFLLVGGNLLINSL